MSSGRPAAAARSVRVCSIRFASGAGLAARLRQPAAVLGVPDADLARPVGGDDARLVVGEDGLERQVAERLEVALLVAVLVPEPDDAVAAGRDEPAVLGEADRGDAAAVGRDRS